MKLNNWFCMGHFSLHEEQNCLLIRVLLISNEKFINGLNLLFAV